MNHKEFNDVVTKELDYVRELLCSKSKEYDFGEDRFHSFKVGGQLQGISQEKCLLGYLTKHIISIYDMCGNVDEWCLDGMRIDENTLSKYEKVVKGGCWYKSSDNMICSSKRSRWSKIGATGIGFRMVFERSIMDEWKTW